MPLPEVPKYKRLGRRYTVIDHHKANVVEVGPAIVLNPAGNPADLAALHTLAENVEPEFAEDLRKHIAFIEAHPQRNLTSYGHECLPHITHPKVAEFAQQRLASRGEQTV